MSAERQDLPPRLRRDYFELQAEHDQVWAAFVEWLTSGAGQQFAERLRQLEEFGPDALLAALAAERELYWRVMTAAHLTIARGTLEGLARRIEPLGERDHDEPQEPFPQEGTDEPDPT